MADNLVKIDLEDIQDLVIQKKFVKINSDKYTDNAFNYIKYLVDQETAIMFDEDTNRIYTLGKYYGGDELKENLLYFSKIISIDDANNILNEINVEKNSDTFAIKGKNGLSVNCIKDEYNTIELDYDLNNAISTKPLKFDPNNEYNLYINEFGKIALNEYIYPKVTIDNKMLSLDDDEMQTLTFNIKSSINISDWELFEISGFNCTIDSFNLESHTITAIFHKGIDGHIIISYSDGKTQDTYEYIQTWYYNIKYGLYDGINFIEYDSIYYSNNNENYSIFTLDQRNMFYAYVILPIEINPIFIDNSTNIKGAWHKISTSVANSNFYNVFITDNTGLGKVEWKIINKKI